MPSISPSIPIQQMGKQMLENFLVKIAKCHKFHTKPFVVVKAEMKAKIGNDKVVSSGWSRFNWLVWLNKAIGENLYVFVNNSYYVKTDLKYTFLECVKCWVG